MNSMYVLVYGEEAMKLVSDRGIIGAAKVSLYAKSGDTEVVVGISVVSNSELTDPTGLQRKLHEIYLLCSPDRDVAVIRATDIIPEFRTVEYPYKFKTNDELPEMLSDVVHAGMYEWDTKDLKTHVENAPDEVEVTRVIDMRPITNMKLANTVNDDDVREVARVFERTAGHKVTVRAFNREDYTI